MIVDQCSLFAVVMCVLTDGVPFHLINLLEVIQDNYEGESLTSSVLTFHMPMPISF